MIRSAKITASAMMQFGAGDSVQTLFVPSETEFAAHLLASGLELQRALHSRRADHNQLHRMH